MAEQQLTRQVPFSPEAEQAVLGSILIDPEKITEVATLLRAEDFYIHEHEQIYNGMLELFTRSRSIDVVNLMEMLVRDGVYDRDESNRYLRMIVDAVPTAANIRDWAKIVHEKAILRKLIAACDEIKENAFAQGDDVSFILDNAEQKIYDIAEGNEQKGLVHIREGLVSTFDHIKLLSTNRSEAQGVATGYSGLDKVLVGMGKSDLIIVGARPAMGKTSFVMNIATKVARSTKKAVCVFSLEMGVEQLVSRMLSSEAMVDSNSMRSGMLSDDDWGRLATASSMLSECDIWVDDTAGIGVTAMKAKLRKVKNLGLVIIDYLQLMQSDRRSESRVVEVGAISRDLKLLAKELQVPVICCAQLSRSSEKREDKRPMLSDLRDSGSIEQDADVVMFLHREEYHKTEQSENQTAEVIVAKNRHGSTKTVEMSFIGKYTKFLTRTEDES